MARRNGCNGKVQYPNQTAAVAAIKRFRNAGLSSYKCGKCKAWHIGNSRNPLRIQARLDQLLSKEPAHG